MSVQDNEHDTNDLERLLRASEERLRLGEAASGIATFDLDPANGDWNWSPQAALLFGFDTASSEVSLATWENAVFVDDVPKIRSAVVEASETGHFYVEFRVRHPDRSLHWIAGRGQVTASGNPPRRFL
jgi:PAS domain-containing protein